MFLKFGANGRAAVCEVLPETCWRKNSGLHDETQLFARGTITESRINRSVCTNYANFARIKSEFASFSCALDWRKLIAERGQKNI